MNKLVESVRTIAELVLLNQDVTAQIEELKHLYGTETVAAAVRKSGFQCILKKCLEG